jgi:hypothetical protein
MTMMMKLLSLLLLAVSVSSFSIVAPASTRAVSSSSARFLFSADQNNQSPKGLETVDSGSIADALSNLSTTQTPRNVVKDMNTGEIKEVKWVDPAMQANTRYVSYLHIVRDVKVDESGQGNGFNSS